MRCPNCKTENLAGSLLCSKCGRSIESSGFDTSNSSLNLDKAPIVGSDAQPFGSAASIDTRRFEEGEIYQPSGKVEASGLPLMIVCGILGGLAVGATYHAISQFFDMIFIFPLAAGIGVGALIGLGVKAGKVRSPRMAGTFGVLGGILVWSVMQVAGAYAIRSEMVEGMTQAAIPTTIVGKNGKQHKPTAAEFSTIQQEVRGEVESYLSPIRTVMIYEEVRGEAGSTLKHNGTGPGMKVSGMGFWGLEALETLALIAAAGAVAAAAASKPFCETCDVWHDKKDVLRVHPVQNPILWEKFRTRDWLGLMDTPVGQKTDSKNLTTISLTSCPKCNCGTLSANSAGGSVPAEIQNFQLSPESTRTIFSASTPGAGPSKTA